jgi:hypothetical protein
VLAAAAAHDEDAAGTVHGWDSCRGEAGEDPWFARVCQVVPTAAVVGMTAAGMAARTPRVLAIGVLPGHR